MTKYILSVLFIFSLQLTILAQVTKLKGVYQGNNLYVMNPIVSSGGGFCIEEVKVNGQVTKDEINASAFEIDLSQFHLRKGAPVSIEIKHKKGCSPKIVNPTAIQPKSTFRVTKISVGRDKILRWTTLGEAGSLDFIVEQYRWNKWVKVATIKGKGTAKANYYTVAIKPHSGENKFRIKQKDFSRKSRYSKDVLYRSMSPAVSFSPKKPSNTISFSVPTRYEIYNYYGKIVAKGYGNKVDISKLKSGDYFLNFDNTMASFKKK